MRMLHYFIAGIFILTSSFYMSATEKEKPVSLYKTKWDLKKIQTDSGYTQVKTKAFLQLNEEKQSAGGNGSCNLFGGNFSVDKDKIHFGNLFSTKMYCPDVQPIENLYLHLLSIVDRFTIEGNQLKLYKGVDVQLAFEKKRI
ncbi:MAG: META domain-containing protein [Chitinophagaceae bacterium]|nr:META domain-containing protein [Chitinophagaceae bacterium]MCB0740627.1 META domain-containing protein [Chitinophagaceae bacterium]